MKEYITANLCLTNRNESILWRTVERGSTKLNKQFLPLAVSKWKNKGGRKKEREGRLMGLFLPYSQNCSPIPTSEFQIVTNTGHFYTSLLT